MTREPNTLSIACPCAPSEPLHQAEYDRELGALYCDQCGFVTEAALVEHLERELSAFGPEAPPLETDELEAERLSAKLLLALPADEFALAADLAVAWGIREFEGRLSEAHLVAAFRRAARELAA